ncbi:hypothetical protein GTW25_10790 [Aliihoeflea aestuarii]|jgi:hypothetical protein|uniref:hypothetical protein n=1 Tax=Aliihoeflea aestuarii TaxID=453840 RepID=UPI0020928EAD|nr:hypothetical protein [Aliihoeflea aestuarii]MCO6391516.1 hypothetical protein [Aliihoeflea aestuarii]
MDEFKFRCAVRPPTLHDGDPAIAVPTGWIGKKSEPGMIISLITNRKLFGYVYWGLQPDFFDDMAPHSGVYVRPLVQTSEISSAERPGDIDLLIVPYEGNTLLLHRVMAIEVKVLRATFSKQGKSPNDMGVSQASALRVVGFPYVALAHLIVSDRSPPEAWREIGLARVLDHHGRAEFLPSVQTDWLPIDLMTRSFGRLMNATTGEPSLGLVSAYLGADEDEIVKRNRPLWIPDTRRSLLNSLVDRRLLERIAARFMEDPNLFFDIPRHDP